VNQVDTTQKVVLITGCATGLGKALVETLARNPTYKIIATARSHRLEHLRELFQESDKFFIGERDCKPMGPD